MDGEVCVCVAAVVRACVGLEREGEGAVSACACVLVCAGEGAVSA